MRVANWAPSGGMYLIANWQQSKSTLYVALFQLKAALFRRFVAQRPYLTVNL
jgi:hypothetical protein